MAGRSIRCPECDSVIKIPELPSEVASVIPLGAASESVMDREPLVAPKYSAPAAVELSHVQPSGSVGGSAQYPEPTSLLSEELEDEPVDLGPRPPDENDMDMTPMVDVTFLLLIFFMITASFSSEKVIQQRTTPKDAASSQTLDVVDTLTIRIDELNSFLIMLPDQSEREASNKQDLLIVLDESRKEGLLDDVENVIVEAHEESIHATVVAALDASRSEGFSNFQVKVVEEFE